MRLNTNRLAGGIAIVALALVALAAFSLSQQTYLNFDEAYNLNLASTLAQQNMYATRFDTGYRWFDPAVTTGPTVILPVALAMRLGGTSLHVVRAALAALFTLYMAITFLAVASMYGRLSVLVFGAVLLSMPFFVWLGLTAMGEAPAACLAIGALACYDRATRTPDSARRLWLAAASGLLLGLAVLAKDIAYLALVAFAASAVVEVLRSRPLRRAAYHLVPPLVALAMVGLWRLYQTMIMYAFVLQQVAEWQAAVSARSDLIWKVVIFDPFSHFSSAIRDACQTYGWILAGFGAAMLCLIAVRWALGTSPVWSAWDRPGNRALFSAAIIWLVWYFCVSGPQAYWRHLVVGVILADLCVTSAIVLLWRTIRARAPNLRVAVAQIVGRKRQGILPVSALALLAALMVGASIRGSQWNGRWFRTSEGELRNQTAIAGWVRENVPSGSPLLGWGWFVPWDIAFLSGRVPGVIQEHPGPLTGQWAVYVPVIEQAGLLDEALKQVLAAWDPPRFDLGGYKVYQITTAGIPAVPDATSR